MNTLNKLTLTNLKLNKKRTIVTLIGIILSTSLICAVAGMVTSLQRSLYNQAILNDGNWHVKFENIPNDKLNTIQNHRDISYSYYIGEKGYSLISENEEEITFSWRPYILIREYSKSAEGYYPFNLLTGRMPRNEHEIVVSSNYVQEYGPIEVGDKITLEVGTRTDLDGNILDIDNQLILEKCGTLESDEDFSCTYEELSFHDEKLINTEKIEYTIVGIIGEYMYGNEAAYAFYTLADDQELNNIDLYALYKNPKDYVKNTEEISPKYIGEDGGFYNTYEYQYNDYLLDLLGVGFSSETSKTLYSLMAIVIVIIMISSVFVIKNGFSISIVERYKQFGLLSSVGATSKQIRRSVLFEGFILGVIAIPLGILCGIVAVFILIALVRFILSDYLTKNFITFYMTLLPIIVAILTSGVTIFLSCLIPALKASRLSIVETIRSNNDIKINPKKLKTPQCISKLFGVGGEIAYKNLKRNRKKYRTTVISLVVSIVIFVSLYFFMDLVFNASSYYYETVNYDLAVTYHEPNYDNKEQSELNKYFNSRIKELLSYGEYDYYSTEKRMILENKNDTIYNSKFIEALERYFGENYSGYYTFTVVGVNNEEYERLIKKIGCNIDTCQNKAILIDDLVLYSEGDEKYHDIEMTNLNDGDAVKLYTYGEPISIEIEIAKKSKEKIISLPEHLELHSTPYLIVNETYYEEISKKIGIKDEYIEVFIQTDDTKPFVDKLEEITISDSSIYYSDVGESQKANEAMVLIVSIFLYGFIAVITLIGVTNIFNTITTNMALRSREFAMLKAIGMTSKEFNHMIRLESVLYGLKSLIIGIPISLVLTYAMNRALANTIETAYHIPLVPIIISVLFVFAIVFITMKYSLNKINKQNIIETIREENI